MPASAVRPYEEVRMSGSAIIDLLIGLVLLYFIFSLICTGIREWIAGIFSTRAVFLEKGIEKLIVDPNTIKAFFDHPLIKNFIESNGRVRRAITRHADRKPSYLHATNFSLAFL